MDIKYKATPTAAQFHTDDSFLRGLMGPVGSGKSVACSMELFRRAMIQEPDEDGIRPTRWAIIRNTYPELKSTTIKTFEEWVPPQICKIRWDVPITGVLRMPLPDGTSVHAEFLFMALDRENDVKKLLSLEITGAWVNEARELPENVIQMLTARVGRYPSKRRVPLTWSGIIMDTNPPDDSHWWYRLAEEERAKNYVFYRQPPAIFYNKAKKEWFINPKAENLENQPRGADYWLDQVSGKSPEFIRVYLEGKYGTIIDGKPVYEGLWDDNIHVADTLASPIQGKEIVVGLDFGLTPAAVICQVDARGSFRVLDEIVSEDMGLLRFTENLLIPTMETKYKHCPIAYVGDPAGVQRSQTDEKSAFALLLELGIACEAASTNKELERLEAVRALLSRMVEARRPALLVNPDCRYIRRGFNGGYRYRRLNVSTSGGGLRFAQKIDKNEYSHVHDALQYACLYLKNAGVRKKSSMVSVQNVSYV